MKQQSGLTLIELMVTIAVMVIALSIGVPSMTQFLKNSELVNTSNKLATVMSFARSEATKRQNTITVCQSNDNATCNTCSDMLNCILTGSSLIVLASDNTLLRTTPLSSSVDFNYQNFSTNVITFSDIGRPNDTGEIVVCDDRGANYAKGVALNMGGQIRSLVASELNTVSCS